ncbi:MAG: prolyl oligopeptidase family serine peptidase [Candidatus Pacebacteria bacterium]|nr:prolyl oligopeptidase family serine peptidase [Candidatus Paceibacterota bacterium]
MNIKKYTKKVTSLFFCIMPLLLLPILAHAGEIHYGSIKEVKGDTILITYKGPSDEQNFTCNIETSECSSHGTTTPNLFPSLLGNTNYSNSPDGNYGLVEFSAEDALYYVLYSFANDSPELVSILPYKKETTYIKFPWASDSIILFSKDGEITRYSINSKELVSAELDRTSFSMRSFSPHGKYFSFYDYTEEAHVIWNINTGKKISLPSETPAYVEFSQDEKNAVFISTRDGYQTLYSVLLENAFAGNVITERIFTDNFTVEDYLFMNNDLYFVANKETPLVWSLYQYNFKTNTTTKAVDNISYGDYIRPIKGMMSFLKIDGKNANISFYDPKTHSVKTISPIPDSPASNTIVRTEVDIVGIHGALLKPVNDNIHQEKPLFIWLHGGPKRATSVEYHPYLSYAVYDELLERLVDSGAYVFKLDYTGSYGYGNEFIEKLTGGVGVTDVQDVINATNKLTQDLPISKIYLIGNSYGGYLNVRTLVEQPDLFAGAISINGVFDWFTLIRRIPSSPFKTYFNGTPDVTAETENLPKYLQASIYSKVSQLTDQKILLVLGEEDATVPTWQTQEFYYFTKGLNKDIHLLNFSEEDHILRKRENLNILCTTISETFELSNVVCE